MRLYALLIALAVLSTGCQRTYLSCRSEYLHPTYLASTRVETPDPEIPYFYGQQILVHWKLPKSCMEKPVTLLFRVRYGNREIEEIATPITTYRGWWIHRLIDEDYWCKEGVISFQAQLLQEDQVVDEWTHFLWTEIIGPFPTSECH